MAQQQSSVAGSRTGAGVLANRATTVPQGTLIPAVLETALDSTRPGLARAVVSRDIRGFDGSRVLVPRGSRLIGEYRSDVERGQNRMLVNWIRLIRPDGATIAIGSPASDPLGQGGIKAEVNSHFFERFAGAILQSALDVGVNLASRAADSSVIVALPGSLQGGGQNTLTQNQVRPTLKVKAATSISIFVARDLDFTGVESR
jgi:type IV secretion system protein VirB10